uniref:Uncharacterized protein n=1 Tax=Fibrocapsa japonica TaxID=94617 RepID=A0A7S2UY46_9STRA|mmetsp:Transcript_19555/g.28203  ORF Transcript_19555/g.28203 Transcript_19555/m.28203 type:complete len:433 (+) Transcript_19555:105-1403(+)
MPKRLLSLALVFGHAIAQSHIQLSFFDSGAADSPVIYYNGKQIEPLHPNQAAEALARVAGQPSPVGYSMTNLPAHSPLQPPPEMTFFMHLNGVNPEEVGMRGMQGWLNAPGGIHLPVTAAPHDHLDHPFIHQILGESPEDDVSLQAGVCGAASGVEGEMLLSTTACKNAVKSTFGHEEAACTGHLEEAVSALEAVGLRLSYQGNPTAECGSWLVEDKTPTPPTTATAGVGGGARAATYDMNDEVSRSLFEEVHLLSTFPAAATTTPSATEGKISMVDVSSFMMVGRQFGRDSVEFRLATMMVDALADQALRSVLAETPEGARPRTGAVLVTPSRPSAAAAGPHHARRRLTSATTSATYQAPRVLLTATNSSSTNATAIPIEDIVQYQINLWVAIGLITAVFAAIMAMCTMEINPDNILTAKFQADLSGLKVD